MFTKIDIYIYIYIYIYIDPRPPPAARPPARPPVCGPVGVKDHDTVGADDVQADATGTRGSTYTSTHPHTHTHSREYIHSHTYTAANTYIYIYIYIHIYIYIYTHRCIYNVVLPLFLHSCWNSAVLRMPVGWGDLRLPGASFGIISIVSTFYQTYQARAIYIYIYIYIWQFLFCSAAWNGTL